MYDVAILGLGPAGATLARLIDPSLRAVAIDERLPGAGGPAKPCGGLLAPDAQKALARFALTLPRDVMVDPQIFSVRTLDLETGLTRYYQRFYLNLDRRRFDAWLRSLIPERVERIEGAPALKIERIEDGFRVHLAGGRRIDCRRLVGADGANSLVRRFLYPGFKPRSYVAIQQWFEGGDERPFYLCVFDLANTDCYSWALSKDGRLLFGGAYPPDGCRARFERQKQALIGRGMDLTRPLATEACQVLRPRGPAELKCGYGGAFLIGEAGGFISPSSLEGISWAIETARLLAGALAAPDPNRAYLRATRALRLKLLLKEAKSPFLYRPVLRHLVMRSGLRAICVQQGRDPRQGGGFPLEPPEGERAGAPPPHPRQGE